jgi:hypothetical protein
MHFETATYAYSGQGVVLIGLRDLVTGRPTGMVPLGNCSDLKLSIAASVAEHKDSQDGNRAVDKRINTEVKGGLSMTLQSWNSANLALALRGDTVTHPSGTVTGEAIIAYDNMVSPLAFAMVSGVVVHAGSVTATAWNSTMASSAKWDYKLNADHGSILFAPAASVDKLIYTLGADAVTVDYHYEKQEEATALTLPMQQRFLRFEGLNTAETNDPVLVEVFKFAIDPLKELALISDTFGQFVIDGSILRDGLQLTGSKYFRVVTLGG